MTLLGVIIFVLGSIIGFGFGPSSIWAVVIARVLQSAGGQVAGSVFLVLVSKYIAKENRVIYYGIFVAVFRFSAALGVVAAGYITKIDWRWLFAVPILSVLFIPSLAKNLPDEHAEGANIDWICVNRCICRSNDHVLYRHECFLGNFISCNTSIVFRLH